MFTPIACFSDSPYTLHGTLADLPSRSIRRRGVWTNVGWKQCCRIDWFGVERVHVHDLVSSRYHIYIYIYIYIIYLLYHSFSYHPLGYFGLSCMIVQVDRRKDSVSTCALPSQNVCLRGPPIRHRRNSSVVTHEV
jgi:hypothetical protein